MPVFFSSPAVRAGMADRFCQAYCKASDKGCRGCDGGATTLARPLTRGLSPSALLRTFRRRRAFACAAVLCRSPVEAARTPLATAYAAHYVRVIPASAPYHGGDRGGLWQVGPPMLKIIRRSLRYSRRRMPAEGQNCQAVVKDDSGLRGGNDTNFTPRRRSSS